MKKIGMIDLHIDEWHANHYPEWFRTAAGGEAFELAGAWEESPAPGGKPLETWCREMGIPAEHNLERLVENCDVLCILAPSNPEVHERLAEIPLASGKPVYLDKPFAPDRATAERLFARAERYHTRLCSSSALRFSDEWLAAGDFRPQFLETRGGGSSFDPPPETGLLRPALRRRPPAGYPEGEQQHVSQSDRRHAEILRYRHCAGSAGRDHRHRRSGGGLRQGPPAAGRSD